MKITVSELPAEGLKINDTIPLEPLNARMKEGRHKEIEFLEAPTVELAVTPTQTGGAQTEGKVVSKYRQRCGRCLDPVERTIEAALNFVLAQRPVVNVDGKEEVLTEDYIDDVGLVYFDGDQIDLEDLVQESLILSLSVFWSPPLKANGKCSLCDYKLEESNDPDPSQGRIKLGDLLKNIKTPEQ